MTTSFPHRIILLLLAGTLATPQLFVLAQTAQIEETAFVDSLMSLMTLDEKLGQLAQYRGRWSDTGPKVPEGGEAEIVASRVGSFLGVYGADYTQEMQRLAVEETRLGIPLIFGLDVIHGFRTIFPMPIAEASSWDPEGVEATARVAAIEAAAYGIHWTFAPMVDLTRDPRWGRIAEGNGEDPYLGSVLTAAKVRGYQGEDLSLATTLLACPKHFAAYGAPEGGRDYGTVDISERTLREIYLPPFKAGVDAGAQTIMAAFNEVSGDPAHGSRFLLTDILRDEWGFDGFVVSDYTGVMELMPHGVAANRAEAGIRAIEAGVDMDMVSAIYVEELPGMVREGKLDEAVVDEAVRRVLRGKYRAGLFEDPYRYSDAKRQEEMTLRPEYRELAREMAGKSMVLMKNEDAVLPLSKGVGKIAVVGPLADNARVMLGGWTAAGRAEDAVTIIDGIRRKVSPETEILYAQGAGVEDLSKDGFAEAVKVAAGADVVVLVVGEHHDMSSEAHNRTNLQLPGVQQELVEAVYSTGTPVVAVLVNGRPLAISWLEENVPAILETWFLGVEMGNAVADVLFGDVNPSGKLPVTFPRNVGQIPIYYNHKNTGRPPSPTNKYTSKYIDVPWTPLYPFGYGLSYTTFEYSNLAVESDEVEIGGSVKVSFDVSNTGNVAGVEVVQLYLSDDVASVTRPVKQLRRFDRVALGPGETATIDFELGPEDFEFLDLDLQPVIEPGTFTVYVGGNSRDVVETTFRVVE